MKKILISILTILGIGVSFCSAKIEFPEIDLDFSDGVYNESNPVFQSFYMLNPAPIGSDITITFHIDEYSLYQNGSLTSDMFCFSTIYGSYPKLNYISYYSRWGILTGDTTSYFSYTNSVLYAVGFALYPCNGSSYSGHIKFSVDFNTDSSIYGVGGSSSSCPDQLIDVQYNNGNTSTISCDGINYITIDGLSTLTNSNVNYEYSPYFNIDYKDEDNQSLIESYSNSILYLSGGLFKKTFTGDNDWILSIQGNSNPEFTGYTPVFDVTGSTDILDNGNVFNNFSDNALKVLLSNIPSYIQYITIFFILLFLFGFIRRFKRK